MLIWLSPNDAVVCGRFIRNSKVLPLNILIQIEQAKTMYKFEHKMLPQVFERYFSKPSHQYGTRYATTQSNFEVVRISSAKEKSLLKYYGPKVWASIPLPIKDSQSLKVFIHAYRTHLIGNYTQYFWLNRSIIAIIIFGFYLTFLYFSMTYPTSHKAIIFCNLCDLHSPFLVIYCSVLIQYLTKTSSK